MTLARGFLAFTALVWLPYGIVCLLWPGHLADIAGVAAHTTTGWAEALAGLVKDGRLRSIELARIDGEPPPTGPTASSAATTGEPQARTVVDHLRAAGFHDSYRGLTFRA